MQFSFIEEPKSDEKPGYVKTLGELGAQLPIGAHDPATGGLNKQLEARSWSLRSEKALGRIRSDLKREHLRFYGAIVAARCANIGGLKLPELDTADGKYKAELTSSALLIDQLWYADVLYAYIWLRYQTCGGKVPITVTCHGCGEKIRIVADLESMEIRCIDKLEDAYWDFTLRDPITIRDKEVSTLKMGPARWAMLERGSVNGAINMGSIKSALVYSSIHQFGGDAAATPLLDAEIEGISKYDLEALIGELDQHELGPIVAVNPDCPKCDREVKTSINWVDFDGFFQVSGRSNPKKK